mmetsp:Transcript_90134/g.280602  ORF Transcript_90134/g.280602 Transcript_90134/m.280602 type:complete len:220 (+) Transcript_90134:60-719(+)
MVQILEPHLVRTLDLETTAVQVLFEALLFKLRTLAVQAPAAVQTLAWFKVAMTVLFKHLLLRALTLQPDVARAVTTWQPHLVGPPRPERLVAEIHEEVMIHGDPALLNVHIELDHLVSLGNHLRVELLVPSAEEARCHVQALAIQRKLCHVRAALDFNALDPQSIWLLPSVRTPYHTTLFEGAANVDLANQLGFRLDTEVIHAHIAMEIVGAEEEAVVH